MKGLSSVSMALVALVGSAVGLSAAESETFTGTAAASGTYKRPQLLVDGKRYGLKASDQADAAVAEVLAEVVARKPGTTPFTFLADIGERHIPGYNAPDFCDLMDTAPFAD